MSYPLKTVSSDTTPF